MKIQRIPLLPLVFFITFYCSSHAQVSLGTTGGDLSGNGGGVSYSVGQYLSAVRVGDMTTLQLGVQQAFEISVVTSTDEELLALNPIVFPNPSRGRIYLKLNQNYHQSYQYRLLDLQGKVLEQARLAENINSIDLTSYAAQVFFISIYHQERMLKTFKIIKP